MPIRFVHSDVQYECDTPEEAVQLHRLLGGSHEASGEGKLPLPHATKAEEKATGANGTASPKNGPLGATAKHGKTRYSVSAFVGGLNSNGRTVLMALAKTPRPARTNDIAHLAGLEAGIIGPIFKHIYAVAERNGLDKSDIVQTTRDPNDPAYKLRYQLCDPIRRALEESDKQSEDAMKGD